MVRAGVFIGVDRTGNLPHLKDAAAGARRMSEWALEQGMEPGNVKLITDEKGDVYPQLITKAIRSLVSDGPGLDQLILYFAGHGVNISRSERWLLTDAPVDTSAAVNVAGSVELARYCGVGHVAVISDACRVAPEGIQAQGVLGVEVFPNDGASDRTKPVDQFFACLLGRTAAELKNPVDAAANFRALYTDVLLEALKGQRAEVLEAGVPPDNGYYVRPAPLETYLERAVPARVRALNLLGKVNQNPDALLTVHSNWLAKAEAMPRIERGASPDSDDDVTIPPPGPVDFTRDLVRAAAAEPLSEYREKVSELVQEGAPGVAEFAAAAGKLAEPFGPDHFESGCGVKIRGGARLSDAYVAAGRAEILGDGDAVRFWNLTQPVSVVLRFREGFGVAIPAIPGYLASLTFEGAELVDLYYEPSLGGPEWNEYAGRAGEIRSLRAVIAAASQSGRFRLDNVEDVNGMARKMQYAKSLDPTLAIFAAYAYYDLQQINRIGEMAGFIRSILNGATLFDVALLARALVGRKVDERADFVPCVPMLSQGWSLLRANRVELDPVLQGIERTRLDSVWSVFNNEGVNLLRDALLSRRVR